MVESTRQAITDFLAQKRIAVVGASRNAKDFNTGLLRDLRRHGYDAVPVNPNATEIEGARCFPRVQEIDPPADAALIMTKPDVAQGVVKDCQQAGIKRVWLYRVSGTGAVSPAAVEFCEKNGITVIPGFCPYMFLAGTQWFHRLHGAVLKLVGKYPK